MQRDVGLIVIVHVHFSFFSLFLALQSVSCSFSLSPSFLHLFGSCSARGWHSVSFSFGRVGVLVLLILIIVLKVGFSFSNYLLTVLCPYIVPIYLTLHWLVTLLCLESSCFVSVYSCHHTEVDLHFLISYFVVFLSSWIVSRYRTVFFSSGQHRSGSFLGIFLSYLLLLPEMKK